MEKDTQKDIAIKKEQEQGVSSPLRLFSTDEKFVFVFKKTQKLVSALYLITGFFQDSEPLKWKLRSLGSRLLSASILLKDGASRRDKAVVDIRAYILEVTALFTVAKQAGMISDMNFEIVNKEFSQLLNSISLSSESYGDESNDLKDEFFSVPRENTTLSTREKNHSLLDQSEGLNSQITKDKVNYDLNGSRTEHLGNYNDDHSRASGINSKQRQILDSDLIEKGNSKDLKEYGAVAVKKNSRQSIIIGLLKRKKEIMIKDVSPLIDGCSEKTIQRELLAMVGMGILKKEGEKRWSKYSLLKP